MSDAPENSKNSNTSFTRKSSATLSVLFTQPTKQSVVLVMFCRPIGCFRFLRRKKSRGKQISFQGQKLQLMQHPKDSEIKVMTSNLHSKPKEMFQKTSHLFTNCTKLHVETNLSVQKVCVSLKPFPNIFKTPKTSQNCSKLHVGQWFKSCTITPLS